MEEIRHVVQPWEEGWRLSLIHIWAAHGPSPAIHAHEKSRPSAKQGTAKGPPMWCMRG